MWKEILIGYAVVALVQTAWAVRRLPSGHQRRGEYLDGTDRLVMGAVALAASMGWVLFVPLYCAGWLRSARGRAATARIAHVGAAIRARLPRRRPEDRHPAP